MILPVVSAPLQTEVAVGFPVRRPEINLRSQRLFGTLNFLRYDVFTPYCIKMTEPTQRPSGIFPPEKTTLDVNEIMRILPHRHPFVLIDRVLELKRRKRIVAIKNVSIDELVLTGQFPHTPGLPGILIAEAIAQAGGILLLIEVEDPTKVLVFLTGIERARFRRPVIPGDQLRLDINVTGWRPNAIRVEGVAYVGNERVAQVTITSATRPAGQEQT